MAVLLAVVPSTADARPCRKVCRPAIVRCVAHGLRRAHCRRLLIRVCKVGGEVACDVLFPTPTTTTTLPSGAATFDLTLGGPSVAVTLSIQVLPAVSQLVVTGVASDNVAVYFCAFDAIRQGDQVFPLTPLAEDDCAACPSATCTVGTSAAPWRATLAVPAAVDLRAPFTVEWHGIALAVDGAAA